MPTDNMTDSAEKLLREAREHLDACVGVIDRHCTMSISTYHEKELLARITAHLSAHPVTGEGDLVSANLAMMLRRMIWQINKLDGDSSLKVLAGKADGLIKQYGLQGSPLRDAPPLTAASGTDELTENGGKR